VTDRPFRALAAGSAWLLTACAWGPGQGIATLERAELSVNVPLPTGRLDATGAWKTNNGALLQLEDNTVTLEGAKLTLLKTEAGVPSGGGGTFDPTNPPPGYGLCHGGHCHRDDGALIDYADIQAEMTQGPRPVQDAPTLGLQAENSTLTARINTPLSRAFSLCEPHCYLPAGALSAVRLEVSSLKAQGTLRTAIETTPRSFIMELPLKAHRWKFRLSPHVVISRQAQAGYRLQASLQVPANLFDDLPWKDWHAIASAPIRIDAAQLEKTPIQENLASARFEAVLQ
jgi:hypothetical protein